MTLGVAPMAPRRRGTGLALTALLVCLSAWGAAAGQDGKVIELTEATFDNLVQTDVWLVDVYATWCSHCRQLEPIWNALAQELKDTPTVHVSKIDGPRNRGLLTRLRVEAFPSIFLLRDGRMWHYTGPRTTDSIMAFALVGYKVEAPLPPHRCPNHMLGRLVGHVHSVPARVKEAYTHLKEEHGWSDLGCLFAMLAVPVVSGVATICAMDALYLRKARRGDDDELYEALPAHPPPAAAAAAPAAAAAGGPH